MASEQLPILPRDSAQGAKQGAYIHLTQMLQSVLWLEWGVSVALSCPVRQIKMPCSILVDLKYLVLKIRVVMQSIGEQGPYSLHTIFFVTYEWEQ